MRNATLLCAIVAAMMPMGGAYALDASPLVERDVPAILDLAKEPPTPGVPSIPVVAPRAPPTPPAARTSLPAALLPSLPDLTLEAPRPEIEEVEVATPDATPRREIATVPGPFGGRVVAEAPPEVAAGEPEQGAAGHAYAPRGRPASVSASQAGRLAVPSTAADLPAVLVATSLTAGLLAFSGFALYNRIRPHQALKNETRKGIYDAVCGNPGLGVHEVAAGANVSYSTAAYHLERLVSAGMLVMAQDGNKLCYYKNGGAFTETERRILPLIKNEEAARLFEAIVDSPGTYRAALAEKLGVTATTINWHLKRLRAAGLVAERREGRNAYLYALTAPVAPSFVSLADKVQENDPAVAERLRRFAAAGEAVPSGSAA